MQSLREGWIAVAGLDVTDPEPLPDDSPLWTMQNVVISPHIAGHSPQRAARNQALVAANLRRFLAGQPLLNVVDLARGTEGTGLEVGRLGTPDRGPGNPTLGTAATPARRQ